MDLTGDHLVIDVEWVAPTKELLRDHVQVEAEPPRSSLFLEVPTSTL